jgi:hypothetical protein
MECVSLLDNQCETRYKEPVSLCNDMRDAPIVRASPIREGRRAYYRYVSH